MATIWGRLWGRLLRLWVREGRRSHGELANKGIVGSDRAVVGIHTDLNTSLQDSLDLGITLSRVCSIVYDGSSGTGRSGFCEW